MIPGKITLFDFYAVWSAPCRKIARVFALNLEALNRAIAKAGAK